MLFRSYEAMLKKYMAAKARKARGKASRAFQEEHVNKIAAGEISIAEFIRQYGYAVYEANKTKYDHAEQYFLQTAYQGVGFRLTYLVTGSSTLGKTPLAKILACSLFPEIKNPREVYFCTGDKGATLQSYRGQPVIIWDDCGPVFLLARSGGRSFLTRCSRCIPIRLILTSSTVRRCCGTRSIS